MKNQLLLIAFALILVVTEGCQKKTVTSNEPKHYAAGVIFDVEKYLFNKTRMKTILLFLSFLFSLLSCLHRLKSSQKNKNRNETTTLKFHQSLNSGNPTALHFRIPSRECLKFLFIVKLQRPMKISLTLIECR